MKIFDCEQRTPEWYELKRGVPSASEFGNIIQPVKMGYAAAADTYINRLIDEVARPEAERSWGSNRHTERGCELEPEAREVYAFEQDVRLQQVGCITNAEGTLLCSPDSLVRGESPLDYLGGLEVKCPDGPTHVAWMREGGLPAEHKAQVHGSLIVTGLPWWDFLSYCPPYPNILVRVARDGFTGALEKHLARFLAEYHAAREKVLGGIL